MGFGEFLLIAFVVLALAAFFAWAVRTFVAGAPAYVIQLVWGVAVLIILVVLARAMGLLGRDIMIPRL